MTAARSGSVVQAANVVSMAPGGGPSLEHSAASSIVARWRAQLLARRVKVVLIDGEDPRAVRAAIRLGEGGAVCPLLVGNRRRIQSTAAELGLSLPSMTEILDPVVEAETQPFRNVFDQVMAQRAASAGRLRLDPLYVGASAVKLGLADACVGGATRPTADVIRAGLHILGVAPDATCVTSSFLMVLPDGRVFTYADCGVLVDPSAEQLAEIALAGSKTYQTLTGNTPVVAMLSFSTKGSATHPVVDKVRDATEIVRRRAPDLTVDGEMQFDAAVVESVGHAKASNSPVAGRATVFVFPNLDAGNIGYKITERLGGARAFGPILQGLAAPMNDVSRGCSAEDIEAISLISAVQAVQGAAEKAPADSKPPNEVQDR